MGHPEFTLKDSGTRREFESGAVRDMSGTEKGRYDLIPPTSLRRLALVYQRGAVKYGEHNWQKGIPLSSFIDSAMRHLQQVAEGKVDEDHAAQAAWNIFAIMWTLEQIDKGALPKTLDDRHFKDELPANMTGSWTASSTTPLEVRYDGEEESSEAAPGSDA